MVTVLAAFTSQFKMVLDERRGKEIIKKLDRYHVLKKKLEFSRAMAKLEEVTEKLTKEGKQSEICRTLEYLVVERLANVTKSEFNEEMAHARISNANLVFDELLRMKVEAHVAERRAKRARK